MIDHILKSMQQETNEIRTPIVLLKDDEQLDFLNKRRLDMRKDIDKTRDELIEEAEKKMREVHAQAWGKIEEHLENKYGIPRDTNLSIMDGVVFKVEEKK